MNRRIGLGILSVVVCMSIIATTAAAQDFSNLKQKVAVDSKIKTGTLPNGLKYYILENKTPEKYARFRLIIRAGSINEDDDQHGLAHFTEHMAFNGTKHYPKNQLLDFLQKTGLQFGAQINAGTGLDQTMYELPMNIENPDMIKKAIEILEDWAHNISYEDGMIDTERGVIVSEFRQGNNSGFRIRNKLNEFMFKDSKYSKRNIIGDTNLLKSFPYSAIKRFYHDWYRPDLMAVVAVGDFNAADVEKMIIKQFSGLTNPENERKRDIFPVPGNKQTIVGIAKDREMVYDIGRIFFKLPRFDESTLEGFRESIKRTLFDKMTAARIAEIQNKPNPPFSGAFASEGELAGDKRSYSAAVLNQNGEFEKGFSALLTELFRVRQHGFTASELERAKKDYLSVVENAFNERNKRQTDEIVNEITTNFTKELPIPGIEYELAATKYFLNTIKPDEVNELANMYMTRDNCVITLATVDKEGVKIPDEKAILALYNKAWETPVEPYVDLVVDKPLFDRKTVDGKIVEKRYDKKLGTTEMKLSNGMKVIVKKTGYKDDEILILASSPGGTSLATDKELGSAQAAAGIVGNSGLGSFDFQSLQKHLTGKVLAITPTMDELSEGFSGNCTPKDLETTLQMINLYFTEPRMDESAYSSYMSNFRSWVAGKSQNPDNVFEDTVQYVLGSYHFRRQPVTEAFLNSIDRIQSFDFYKKRFADAGDFTFVIVGDIDTTIIDKMVEKYLGSLPGIGRKETWKDPGVKLIAKPVEKKVFNGKEARSHVRLVLNGKFDFSIRNTFMLQALKEQFNILFDQVVREEKAGVYSGRIFANTQKYPGGEYSIVVDFICDPNRIDELTQAVKDIMTGLKNKENPETAEKVKKAQEFQQKLNFERNGYWAGMLNRFYLLDESPEQILEIGKWTEEITPSSLKQAANKYFNMDRISRFVLLPEVQ